MTDIPDDEQKILAEMPLHAITAVYGEQGLGPARDPGPRQDTRRRGGAMALADWLGRLQVDLPWRLEWLHLKSDRSDVGLKWAHPGDEVRCRPGVMLSSTAG